MKKAEAVFWFTGASFLLLTIAAISMPSQTTQTTSVRTSRFDLRLISLGLDFIERNNYDLNAGTVNVVMGNSFAIDLEKGVIRTEATAFEKVIEGETFGSTIRIEPQEINIPLNCCYNTVFVYEYVPNKDRDWVRYRTVYSRNEDSAWKIAKPRVKIE